MVTYPIHIQRQYYRGSDLNRKRQTADKNRLIGELQNKINAMLLQQTEPIKQYDWSMIASETGYSRKFIEEHGFTIAGGTNGFTAVRHDLTYEQAQAMLAQQREQR